MAETTLEQGTGPIKVSDLTPVVLDEQQHQRDPTVGINVSLHPLPIINMSEHQTRTAMQSGSLECQIVGALLGTQSGREIEVQTTFEFLMRDGDVVDHEFLQARQGQFKQVFPSFDFLGWYSNGSFPTQRDMDIHRQLLDYNESPLFLQLSPGQASMNKAKGAGELPIGIYETHVEVASATAASEQMSQPSQTATGPTMYFRPVHYTVETGEAERIAVDHASKPPVQDEEGQSSLVANLTTQYNAIRMLYDRVQTVTAYIDAVLSGQLPRDHESLRQISSLVAGLPASGETEEFQQEFLTEYNDLLLTTYLSDMTNSLNTLNELVDKFDVAMPGSDDTFGTGSGPATLGRSKGPRSGARMGRGFAQT